MVNLCDGKFVVCLSSVMYGIGIGIGIVSVEYGLWVEWEEVVEILFFIEVCVVLIGVLLFFYLILVDWIVDKEVVVLMFWVGKDFLEVIGLCVL